MPFLDHLEDLRRVLIDSLIAIGVGMAATWALSGWVLETLIATTMPAGVPVIFLGPAEAFSARIKVALATGVLLTLPFVLWRLWRFVVPGLLKEERGLVLPLVLASTVLFYLGGTFGLLVLVPVIMNILLSFGTASMVPNIAVGQLLTFILRLVLACGTIFELPLVTTALALAGLVTGRDLIAKWRYAVVVIFVVAAVVTPGDGPSLLVLAIPMIALYFLSVGLAFAVEGRGRKRERGLAAVPPAIGPPPAAAGIVPRPAAPPEPEPAAPATERTNEGAAEPPSEET
jgi:sec-independent protein translocase protein TatC